MSIKNSTSDKKQRVTTTITDWFESIHPGTTPLVRYGFPRKGGGQDQEMKLRSLYEPIPEKAITASAIYFVTDSQLSRLQKLEDNPFAVTGDGNIVKEVQSECEQADRVRYPVFAESDAREDDFPFTTMIAWIRGFVEDLGVSTEECTFWYSGSRSIHVHLPKFITHSQVMEIRSRAKQYCKESDAELDTGIYKAKQQFRLPGVAHRKSAGALQKVQIEPSWENDKIIRTSSADHTKPESYLDMLQTTFSPQSTGENFALTLNDHGGNEIKTPLIEQTERPEKDYDVPEWSQYNDPQFSPYSLADGNSRSVAALEVKGGAFAREDKRDGAVMVPAHFFGAVGCNGSYTKEAVHAPLQLSEGDRKDYEKWVQEGYGAGDYVVIIGGQSRSSIIHSVSRIEALKTGFLLIREDGGRQDALKYLSGEGYDVGSATSASYSKKQTSSKSKSQGNPSQVVLPARENTTNDAERFQWIAEQKGIENLSYAQINKIAHRLLRYGWEPTWEWFEKQYGSEFKPVKTWKKFRSIVEESSYDEYDEVEVPEKPV